MKIEFIMALIMALCAVVALSATNPAQAQDSREAAFYASIAPAAGAPDRAMRLDRTQVRNVQYALERHGYTPGYLDGVMGPRTESALRRFQMDNNLPVTGMATNETLIRLGFIAREDRYPDHMRSRTMNAPDIVPMRRNYDLR